MIAEINSPAQPDRDPLGGVFACGIQRPHGIAGFFQRGERLLLAADARIAAIGRNKKLGGMEHPERQKQRAEGGEKKFQFLFDQQ